MASSAHNPDIVSKLPGSTRFIVASAEVLYYGNYTAIDTADGLLYNFDGSVATHVPAGFVMEDGSLDANITGDGATVAALVTAVEIDTQVAVVGVTGIGDVLSAVYATDDNTFTLTPTTAGAVGKVMKFLSGTNVLVRFAGVTAV